MRTTVDIKPEHRSALLAIAARRGQKGFSTVLEEAIESYLAGESEQERHKKFLSFAEVLTEQEADEFGLNYWLAHDKWKKSKLSKNYSTRFLLFL